MSYLIKNQFNWDNVTFYASNFFKISLYNYANIFTGEWCNGNTFTGNYTIKVHIIVVYFSPYKAWGSVLFSHNYALYETI